MDIGPGSPHNANSLSSIILQSIPESVENGSREHVKDSEGTSMKNMHEIENGLWAFRHEENTKNQQEYFVPLAFTLSSCEVGGTSAYALANGLAMKEMIRRVLLCTTDITMF